MSNNYKPFTASQNYNPEVLWMSWCTVDCCTERYEKDVLLPNHIHKRLVIQMANIRSACHMTWKAVKMFSQETVNLNWINWHQRKCV